MVVNGLGPTVQVTGRSKSIGNETAKREYVGLLSTKTVFSK